MGDFTVYILKSSLSIAVFFLFYKLLLSRETFHKFNRILLLSILVLSFLIPFINLSLKSNPGYSINTAYLQEVLNTNQITQADANSTPFWVGALILTYLAGVCIALIVQIISFTRMLTIIKSSRLHSKEGGVKILITTKHIAPFSWMNYFVINSKDFEADGDVVAAHERAHISRRHSIDILLSEAALIFQWFNPAIYLLKLELQSIHEYEADEAVINQGIDAKKYQLLLIKKAVGQRLFTMANSFNHGKLKKRITMMVREKSKKWAAVKALFILPAAAIALTAFASEKVSAKTELISNAEILMPAVSSNPVLKDTIKVKKESKEIKVIVTNKDGKIEKKVFINGKEVPQDSLMPFSYEIDSTNGKKNISVNVSNIEKTSNGENYIVIKENNVIYFNTDHKVNKDSLKLMINKATDVSRVTKTGGVVFVNGEHVKVIKGEKVSGNIVGKDTVFVKYATDSAKKQTVYIAMPKTSIAVAKEGKMSPNILYIIDGKEGYNLESLDPNLIESMTVLKDKSAIETYGEKGKNGVIVIVTKKAK